MSQRAANEQIEGEERVMTTPQQPQQLSDAALAAAPPAPTPARTPLPAAPTAPSRHLVPNLLTQALIDSGLRQSFGIGRRLAALPAYRHVALRADIDTALLLRDRANYRTGGLVAIVGRWVPEQCTFCVAGRGPFADCYVASLDGRPVVGGACANCVWISKSTSCSLRARGDDDGNNDDKKGGEKKRKREAEGDDNAGVSRGGGDGGTAV